jgi:hypothetical protein
MELATQNRDQKVTVTGGGLEERRVDEVGAGLQFRPDQVEHSVDHVTRSEDLTVSLDAMP